MLEQLRHFCVTLLLQHSITPFGPQVAASPQTRYYVVLHKWGRTGFDWRSDNRIACRGRLVGLVKNRVKKINCQPRIGSRGLIDRDVPDRTPAKVGSDDSRLVQRRGDRAGGREKFRGRKGEPYAPIRLVHLITIG
jgi:hypothetical protein